MRTMRSASRVAMLIAVATSVLIFASSASAQDQDDKDSSRQSNNNTWPYAKTGKSPVLVVVGDISCQPGAAPEPLGESAHELCVDPKAPYSSTALRQSQEATANQIEAMKPDLVAIVGDLQYQVGEYSDFEQSFDLTYGAFKFLHRPSPGNHEFYDEHSQTGVAGYGYFSYYNGFQTDANGNPITTTIPDPCPSTSASICNFPGLTTLVAQPIPRADGQAGHFDLGANGGVNGSGVGEGWYSYNLGNWHLISLNIECGTAPGGCSDSGAWLAAELAWLDKDLDENRSECTLAYWHQPTFSAANSISTEGITAQAFWRRLYEHHADLVLNGHDHLYARYRQLDPSGNPDPKRGLREFIVGTGGETLDAVSLTGTSSNPGGDNAFNTKNIEASSGFYWGVMALTLDKHGYKWDFESALKAPLAGAPASPNYSDTGVAVCHGSPNADRDDKDHDH